MRVAAIVLAVSLLGCTASRSGSEPTTSLAESHANVETLQQRLNQLRGFQADDRSAGEQCDDLSASNGTVQLDASLALLPRTFQDATVVTAEDLNLIVHFGSGFPAFTCTDLASEVRLAVIEESWPASAEGGVFTVTPADRCSVAQLTLQGVVVKAPNGDAVVLGTMTITNEAWQWWPPSECHLD